MKLVEMPAQNGIKKKDGGDLKNIKKMKTVQKKKLANPFQDVADASNPKSKKDKLKKSDNSADDSGFTSLDDEIEVPAYEVVKGSLTNLPFSSLKKHLSQGTLKALEDMGMECMMEIQAKSIPKLLSGSDLMASAKTGSGKTLGFLIPAIERLLKMKVTPEMGTMCFVISPTRELSMQTFKVLDQLLKYNYTKLTYGIVMGGAQRGEEEFHLRKGCNILVATPGRLNDHMENTRGFNYSNCCVLIIDEADRILTVGFEREMHDIVKRLPPTRQTMLFSATQTRKTEDLARISLKKEPFYVGVDDTKQRATSDFLDQSYILIESQKRLLYLVTFLESTAPGKKVMVFFSTTKSTEFHYELFLRLLTFDAVMRRMWRIHGKLAQNQRSRSFKQFCQAKDGLLLCTDVAARGLDIPEVDWIVQYDPPCDPDDYIHRVGRTARGLSEKGNALLILRPEESRFADFLRRKKVPIVEQNPMTWEPVSNIDPKLGDKIKKIANDELYTEADEAFRAYMAAYRAHTLKTVFDVRYLTKWAVAPSFGC